MTRTMKKLAGSCFLVALAFGALGCSAKTTTWLYPHDRMETTAETGEEHYQRVLRIEEQRRKSLAEDLDLFFLTERPTRLTRWHED